MGLKVYGIITDPEQEFILSGWGERRLNDVTCGGGLGLPGGTMSKSDGNGDYLPWEQTLHNEDDIYYTLWKEIREELGENIHDTIRNNTREMVTKRADVRHQHRNGKVVSNTLYFVKIIVNTDILYGCSQIVIPDGTSTEYERCFYKSWIATWLDTWSDFTDYGNDWFSKGLDCFGN